jgi:succinate dehydrogenase / fumarate reductase cytochrome b subunit
MTWFVQSISRSIGKKLLVALTGLSLCGFLSVHLVGNLLIFAGPETFNDYAKKLEDSFLLVPAEVGLVLLFGAHMVMALWVTVENWRARPERYVSKAREGGRSLGSGTMWITGPLIFAFLIVHLINFRFADRGEGTLYDLVISLFRSLPYVVFYVVSMLVAAFHVSHGFQSVFRSLGLVHPRFTPIVSRLGWAFAGIVACGYGAIAIWIHFFMESGA